MARAGPVGGAATMSSFRVQKAFSINFRENKRLTTEIKLIENEHIRNIRQVKQDIKETRIWLDNIRESTGESSHGLRPETEPEPGKRKKKIKAAPVEPVEVIEIIMSESNLNSEYEDDDVTKYSEQEPISHVRFSGADVKPDMLSSDPFAKNNVPSVRPWTDAANTSTQRNAVSRSNLKSEPAGLVEKQQKSNEHPPTDASVQESSISDKRKNRVLSAASGRSSLASLTTYQRRHKLQAMMVKKQNPLQYKRLLNSKDCSRVNSKVAKYLEGLAERMTITLPDMAEWNVDLENHETPFAKDSNIAS